MFFKYAAGFLGFCLISNYTLKTQMNMDNTAIWYLLHFICNMMVIYLTFNDLKICFTSQSECYDNTHFDSSALGITFGLHTVHMIRDYKTLTIIDWLHHLISNWFMSLLGVYYYHIPLWNCGAFFLCGLPGGIDYFLLFLYKMKKIDKMTEKHINVYLNNWIRLPGVIYCSALMNYGYMNGFIEISRPLYLIGQFLTVFNAIYFAQRVTLNYSSNMNNKIKYD